ncbi:Basement membrane-specific heparan sulfate proteoglycan core protein [Eumeta japonica]|uniref:Basement membrane-specific heparan sulfate proteoglycan core protein n=1 Tax=Eumeta variegata TaxID=151549 RepID=A0A4C1XRD5_EUMVA|nr:Basement membrane-specific heparan sulfate proteoglycan core protein [Eumeta japonica]
MTFPVWHRRNVNRPALYFSRVYILNGIWKFCPQRADFPVYSVSVTSGLASANTSRADRVFARSARMKIMFRAAPPPPVHRPPPAAHFPRVEIGPENPLRVEVDGTATMECKVDAKPKVISVRWTRSGKFISSSFTHIVQGVTAQDAGKYTCSADNGLGRVGERELYLDVLYPPTVTVESKTYDAEEGSTVEIHCDVSANPEPVSVEWTMEGRPEFRQNGQTLLLPRVTADSAGTYVCRATNVIATSGGKRVERTSSATVAVLVRHRPGRARISPDRPVAHEGAGVTLTCSAKPPGWPAPQYRWFRDVESVQQPAVLFTGNKYTIPSAHLGSEGVYRCQASNELGQGEPAAVTLEVHQPPRFTAKLQPHATRRAGDADFSVACTAPGKPRPSVRWLKDGAEITPDANLYEVNTEANEAGNAVYTIHSVLRFRGKARPETDQLLPEDRGVYSCVFENEVKKVESAMHLRIEHKPIPIRQQHKVAFDLLETAEIACRVQAYPKPEFQWYFGTNSAPLQMSSDGHYEINTTTDSNDSYLSVLRIRNVKSQDYGDYYCKVKNTLGTIKPQIRLQPKGAPESPRGLKTVKVGPSYVTLSWEPGFDGGLINTKYFVRYRRVPDNSASSGESGECALPRAAADWLEYDCGRANPCNVTGLDQHASYLFKVKAVNTKGQSNYSNDVTVTTKVDRIPAPEQVTYEPSSRTVAFSVSPTCLTLVGVAETLLDGRSSAASWQVVDTIPLRLSGTEPSAHEAVIDHVPSKAGRTNNGRALNDLPLLDELNPRVRLKLCLRVNQDHCSDYTEAEIGPAYIKEASALTTPTLVAIVVSCLVFLLFLSLLFIFCRCKRNESKKHSSKDYEMESMRPSMVTPQNQAPPPYYPSTGMENKALEHSMDLALSLEDSKSAVYATQARYGYPVASHVQGHPGQNMSSTDWVNMGYIENSYTNSNNGGSVNSQDSMWQMKMAAANTGVGGIPASHQMLDRQSNYGYDPISQGGYAAADEYAAFTHAHAPPPLADTYAHAPQGTPRHDYCSDPYASVHKTKKRLDQHIESPYHEVSGLPEPYGSTTGSAGGGAGADGADEKPAHLSLGYDDALESGYSTPNSRGRRVIREIIV